MRHALEPHRLRVGPGETVQHVTGLAQALGVAGVETQEGQQHHRQHVKQARLAADGPGALQHLHRTGTVSPA
jgi:hypothetical protein